MIGQLCLAAHLSTCGNWYKQYPPYKPDISQRASKCVPIPILYLFIIILMEFLKYELSTIFTIYGIYQCIFSLDIFYFFFRSVCANTMNWVIFNSVRPPF